MRMLLDVNVLIALLDPDHVFHARCNEWFFRVNDRKWATCPLTENGFVRSVSRPGYSERHVFSLEQLVDLLSSWTTQTDHEFWPDDLSILDRSIFRIDRILGPRQITDVYLLALAVKNNSGFATFDSGTNFTAVAGCNESNVEYI